MSDRPLNRDDLLANGFAVVDGSNGCIYRHLCGLEVSIPTYPEFDDHEKKPWWWGMGWEWPMLPRPLNPKTVAGLHHLMALAGTPQEGKSDGTD